MGDVKSVYDTYGPISDTCSIKYVHQRRDRVDGVRRGERI